MLGAPHRDPRERLAVGQVEPPHLEHRRHAEELADPRRRRHEAEVEDAPLGAHAGLGQLPLDGAEPAERLAQRVDRREPAEALAGVHQPLVAQQLERLADRDPAGLVRCGQLGLARQRPAGRELARLHPPSQLVGDRPVADLAHLSYTCMQRTTTQGVPAMPTGATVSASTPIELVQEVYARLPERVALGRDRLGRGLTLAEKILVNHLRDASQEHRARAHLQRLRPRPRRHAGRHRPDGAAAVHDRRPRRGWRCRPPCTATTSSRPRPAPTSTSSSRSTPTARSTSSSARCRRSTASASGSRAAGSSTRSCSRTTRSPAG